MIEPKAKAKKLIWTDYTKQKFKEAKDNIINYTKLCYYNPEAKLRLYCDSSIKIISGVLYQEVTTLEETDLEPLGYFSKALSSQEITFSIFEKELRAIFYSIRYFDQFLRMRPLLFIVIINH